MPLCIVPKQLEWRGEYDENLFLVEDYEYWVRLWMCTKVARIEECLYFTRVHPGTLTEIRKKDIARKLLEMRLMYFDKFTDYEIGRASCRERV